MAFYIFIFLLLILDVYVFKAFQKIINSKRKVQFLTILYIFFVIVSYLGIYTLITNFRNNTLNAILIDNLLVGVSFSFIIFKFLISIYLLVYDLIRVLKYVFNLALKISFKPKKVVHLESRRHFITRTGFTLASLPFISFLYGTTKGKYNYKIKEQNISFKNLPSAFHNFKIVHISDIHIGSFDSFSDVEKGVELINEQNADVILFTGDLVNNIAKEVLPYIDLFKSLKSKYGVFSILGNHDYGDYKRWDSEAAKKENLQQLFKFHDQMGFQLLNNEGRVITIENQSINIIGVENWGLPPFPKYGDLSKALHQVPEDAFKILLSHDPTHFESEVIHHKTQIDLTLSGHTHGMQFGVEILGYKWSPVQYKYPRWAGLYKENDRLLYVNRGFGFLGFPGRVGIWPEITVLNLLKK